MSVEKFIQELRDMKLGNPDNKFGPKLDFDQRCEILALWRTGLVSRMSLSRAYGIDRRTVSHIYANDSVHYRDVREEEAKLGKDAFLAKYLTENAMAKLKAMPKKVKAITEKHAV